MNKQPTKNQKQLLEKLGSDYYLDVIDCELCICRKISKYYEIEISGTASVKRPYHVYVWQIHPHLGIVEKFFDIKDETKLFGILTFANSKYQNLIPQD